MDEMNMKRRQAVSSEDFKLAHELRLQFIAIRDGIMDDVPNIRKYITD